MAASPLSSGQPSPFPHHFWLSISSIRDITFLIFRRSLPLPPISAVVTASALADALCLGILLPLATLSLFADQIFSLPSLSIWVFLFKISSSQSPLSLIDLIFSMVLCILQGFSDYSWGFQVTVMGVWIWVFLSFFFLHVLLLWVCVFDFFSVFFFFFGW